MTLPLALASHFHLHHHLHLAFYITQLVNTHFSPYTPAHSKAQHVQLALHRLFCPKTLLL